MADFSKHTRHQFYESPRVKDSVFKPSSRFLTSPMFTLALPTSISAPAEFVLAVSSRRGVATARAIALSPASSSVGCSLPSTRKLPLASSFNRAFRINPRVVSVTRKSQGNQAVADMEVIVKSAVSEPDRLGDCPFSQRVLLTLEEKHIPYNARFVDLKNKPQWFLDLNPSGKVPVLKVNNEWVPDSDVITEILEKDVPEPSLKVSEENAKVGSTLFGAFLRFLKSKDPSDGTQAAVVAELKTLDTHLAAKGPYIDGEKITSVDLALLPKLYHLRVALGHFKKFSIPAEFTSLLKYMEVLESRESFKKTAAAPDLVIKGWAAHDGVL